MHEATIDTTVASERVDDLHAAAIQAEQWFGEPFLAPDEDPATALAPGTARRAALDDALATLRDREGEVASTVQALIADLAAKLDADSRDRIAALLEVRRGPDEPR